jgi:hypothetical protein
VSIDCCYVRGQPMHRLEIYFLASLLLPCAVGCQSGVRHQSFSHQQRADYVIRDAEFENLQFYISAKVHVPGVQ